MSKLQNSQKDEKAGKHNRSHSNEWEKIKNLKVKNLCAETATIKTETVVDLNVTNLTTTNLNVTGSGLSFTDLNVTNLTAENADIHNETVDILNGMDYNCFFKTPTIKNVVGFDCMDCDGNPIKPDNIRQDIWDFLICNMEAYRVQMRADFQTGRDQIRCIKKAYGCAPECPPDCPSKAGCTGGCPEPPNCTIDPACIPDPNTCVQDIENKVYATKTILPFSAEPCGQGSKWIVNRPNNFTYALNVNNVSCSLATRVASVFVHYAFLSTGSTGATGMTGASGPTGPECPVCPGQTGANELSCLCDIVAPDIVCGIIDIGCQQFGPTININLGEKFTGIIQIPTDIIETIYRLSPNDASIGALQMVVFIEDDLEIFNNKSLRGGGGSSTDQATTSYSE